jgi:hypothetical protein
MAGPATPAAIPVRTKIPAPIIAPTPIIVTEKRLRSRLRPTWVPSEEVDVFLSFVWAILIFSVFIE